MRKIWEEKMKDINKEYQEKYKLNNGILQCKFVCKMCKKKHVYVSVCGNYPVNNSMIKVGIVSLYRCVFTKYLPCNFVPYPQNY